VEGEKVNKQGEYSISRAEAQQHDHINNELEKIKRDIMELGSILFEMKRTRNDGEDGENSLYGVYRNKRI
jgi:hypothetical protein